MSDNPALDQRFEQAAQEVQGLPERPDTETLLQLYSLYKQGAMGDVTGKRPGMMDFKGRAKYDAWKALEGTDPAEAKQRYIDLVERLKDAAAL
jgi:acyl-CoA-binding protein